MGVNARAEAPSKRCWSRVQRKPDPQEQQDAEYRTQLARGTDPREMTWLKLRAYHRAINQYENHVAAVEGLEAKQRLQDYQVPTDLVPAQLLQLSPEELLASSKLTSIEDHRAARTEAAAAAVAAAAGEQSGVSGGWHGAGAGYTTEAAGESRSRRIADQYGISADEWRQGLAAAFPSLLQPHMPPWQQQQLEEEEEEEEEGSGGEGPPGQQGLVQEVRVLLPYSNPPRSKPRAMEPRTIYTEAYLAEQALLRQWRQQSRQRTLAFWSGLGTVTALNMQRIGESRWRPLELCHWPKQGALPAMGKEYPGLGYKRLRDKPSKAQQQQQPAVAHSPHSSSCAQTSFAEVCELYYKLHKADGQGNHPRGVLWSLRLRQPLQSLCRSVKPVQLGKQRSGRGAFGEMICTAGAVAAKFPGVPLDMTYEATPTSTGKFEVTVNGELVFSKLAGNHEGQEAQGCTSRVSSAMNRTQPCEEGLDRSKPTRPEGWKPQPRQVQHRLLRSAWSKRFEAPVRGLMWCPELDQTTPGDLGKWLDRGCNAALSLSAGKGEQVAPTGAMQVGTPRSGSCQATSRVTGVPVTMWADLAFIDNVGRELQHFN
ncbi:hypothetical protein QJQ45_018931 [Haematococcus lacustris]|nr:hypothetical protein QJQ45_018931 [Haematococcus lacustris]